MPFKSSTIIIAGTKNDKRIKLSDDDKELIRELRENEEISYNKLAERFGVSKRSIIFVCKPETLEACKKARDLRGGSAQYYNKEANTEKQRNHRRYKQDLFVKGIITLNDSENDKHNDLSRSNPANKSVPKP